MKSGRGGFRASREKAEEPGERVETRVVAGREGAAIGRWRIGEWRVARGETSGKRWPGGWAVEAGVVSRLRPPSGERLLANYL